MSKIDSLHYQLCVEGGKWLKRSKPVSEWTQHIERMKQEFTNI